ncbi:O-succinylhomoserine sulfhydrylase [Endozoicomonadaceae bacterium StTr2]
MTVNKAEQRQGYDAELEGCAPQTLAVRSGQQRTDVHEHCEPIFTTSSYVFRTAAEAAAVFSGEQPGNIYSRYTNPTVAAFEQRMAALEGGESAVATASGMAAIFSVCMAHLEQGDHVICSRSVFGTTTTLFSKYLPKMGVKVSFVDLVDLHSWEEAMQPNTRMLFLETPSNPLSELADLRQLGKLAHANNALLVVDNCFLTPLQQQPLKLGADIVVHSATKYIDGQGRCIGGVAIGSAEHMKEVALFMRACGPSLSPFNAWILLKGIETLPLRIKAHSESAGELAQWLQQQPGISKVHYCGLEDHPQHQLAKQQQNGFGGVLAFEVEGGQEAAWRFIDSTRLVSITANLGDARTTITHPASTTHCRLSDEDKQKAGIVPGLIRVAVGLEDISDLKKDLARGLATL